MPGRSRQPLWSLSTTTSGRWGTPAASTAPASTSLRCGSGRWCSRPPWLRFRLGWSLFQRSSLDLPCGKWGDRRERRNEKDKGMDVALLRASLFRRGGGVMQRAAGSQGSQSRPPDLFTGMHRWACFCNTKALLLVSPSPSTWSALHPNALQQGSCQALARQHRGSREDGVNHFSLQQKATALFSYYLHDFSSHTHTHTHTHTPCAIKNSD